MWGADTRADCYGRLIEACRSAGRSASGVRSWSSTEQAEMPGHGGPPTYPGIHHQESNSRLPHLPPEADSCNATYENGSRGKGCPHDRPLPVCSVLAEPATRRFAALPSTRDGPALPPGRRSFVPGAKTYRPSAWPSPSESWMPLRPELPLPGIVPTPTACGANSPCGGRLVLCISGAAPPPFAAAARRGHYPD